LLILLLLLRCPCFPLLFLCFLVACCLSLSRSLYLPLLSLSLSLSLFLPPPLRALPFVAASSALPLSVLAPSFSFFRVFCISFPFPFLLSVFLFLPSFALAVLSSLFLDLSLPRCSSFCSMLFLLIVLSFFPCFFPFPLPYLFLPCQETQPRTEPGRAAPGGGGAEPGCAAPGEGGVGAVPGCADTRTARGRLRPDCQAPKRAD